MKNKSLKKTVAFIMSLLITVGVFAVLPPFIGAVQENSWSIADTDFAGGLFKITAFTAADGEITLTVEGVNAEKGQSSNSDGYRAQEFLIDTTLYKDGPKRIALQINGQTVLEKSVFFDNTAPEIPSWEAIGPEGKYTAYDMTVWPNDVLVLNTDGTFDIDFSPTDGEGSGIASVTAKLNEVSIPVPFTVEYEYLKAGVHYISYTLTDKLGNSVTKRYSFEVKKPEAAYSDVAVSEKDNGICVSAKLSGDFKSYTAKFYLAELLKVNGFENVTDGDVSGYSSYGERPLSGKIQGSFITSAVSGAEVYHCFDIDVKGKTGSLYADYAGEIPVGSRGELSVYSHIDSEWKVIITKTSYKGQITLSLGKKGISIADYAKDGVIRARVRVISDSDDKYIKTVSFIPAIRFNSQIGDTQTGANGTVASVIYSGRVTSDIGWYIKGEADFFNSYSPTYTFDVPSQSAIVLKQFNLTFTGDVYTRVGITWQTAEKTATRVQVVPYGDISPDFSSAVTYTGTAQLSEQTGNYVHKVKLTGLVSGKKYWLRYGDSNENIWSEPCLLEMPEKDSEFSFAAASPSADAALNKAWNSLYWSCDPDFLLTSGNEATDEASWDKYFSALSKPLLTARAVPAAGTQSAESWWTKYNLSEQTGAGHENGVYYSFEYKNSLFAVLNTNDITADGELGSMQIRWLKKLLAEKDFDWKFVLLGKSLNGQADASALASQLCPIFEENGVDVVFCEGGYALNGSLGEEIFTFEGKEYFSAPSVIYVNLPLMSEDFVTVKVKGAFMELSCGQESISLFSSSRMEWIAERIAALPSPQEITVDFFDDVRELRELYDSLDVTLAELFVTDIGKLVEAEARLAELVLVIPPEIKVVWNISKRVVLGRAIKLPSGVATDLTDGRTDIVITVTDPDGEDVKLHAQELTAEKTGMYTVSYTSEDSDGNIATCEYSFTVCNASLCDVDGNGKISIADALTALRVAAKIIPVDDVYLAAADTDSDGTVTVSDALFVLETVVGLRSI